MINNENTIITNKEEKSKKITLENEVLRKSIHLTSLLIPVIYIFVDKLSASIILLALTFIGVGIDIFARINLDFKEVYLRYFGGILRKHEKKKKKIQLNGASWVLLASFLTVVLFPKIVAITALTILIVCDATAALVGRFIGKHKLFDKTWEGTTAFVLSGILIVVVYGFIFDVDNIYFVAAIIGTIIAAIAEALSKFLSIDDNLTIPISVGVTMMFISLIFSYDFNLIL